MMKFIRWFLGGIILFADRVFVPASMVRTTEQQVVADQKTKSLVIYELNACPFCVKVRREIKRLGIAIARRDVGTDPKAQQELMAGGKQDQVPCLQIKQADGSFQWMYESSDIVSYLQKEFA